MESVANTKLGNILGGNNLDGRLGGKTIPDLSNSTGQGEIFCI